MKSFGHRQAYESPRGANPSGTASSRRIPAGELETLIVEHLSAKLNDRHWLQANVLSDGTSPDAISETADAARRVAGRIAGNNSRAVRQQINELVRRIDMSPDKIGIRLNLAKLLPEGSAHEADQDSPTCTIEMENPFTSKSQSKHLVVRQDAIPGNTPPRGWSRLWHEASPGMMIW